MHKLVLESRSVSKPTKIVQISDSHVIVADRSDGELYKEEKARKLHFERETLLTLGEVLYAEEELNYAIEYARGADLTVFTGDIVEFATEANVRKMMECFSKCGDYLYTFGNHDYITWWDREETPEEQHVTHRHLFTKCINNDLEFAVKNVNNVNIVALDNSLSQFTERQYVELKRVLNEDRDAILFMHVPLYHPNLSLIGLKTLNRVVFGCGSEYNLESPLYPTETTRKVINLIKEKHEKVLALMTGHVHFAGQLRYHENIIECICPPTYLHEFFEIEINCKK